jgi:hypothetical protein
MMLFAIAEPRFHCCLDLANRAEKRLGIHPLGLGLAAQQMLKLGVLCVEAIT